MPPTIGRYWTVRCQTKWPCMIFMVRNFLIRSHQPIEECYICNITRFAQLHSFLASWIRSLRSQDQVTLLYEVGQLQLPLVPLPFNLRAQCCCSRGQLGVEGQSLEGGTEWVLINLSWVQGLWWDVRRMRYDEVWYEILRYIEYKEVDAADDPTHIPARPGRSCGAGWCLCRIFGQLDPRAKLVKKDASWEFITLHGKEVVWFWNDLRTPNQII